MYQNRTQIIITDHARQRLTERCPHIPVKNQKAFVSSARYNGYDEEYLKRNYPRFSIYIQSKFSCKHKETIVRVYKGYVFIFCGGSNHGKCLKTVISLDDLEDKTFDIPQF